nr:RNA-directed DNA polymerase, eukaryota [Tanacetum cinerariifolium]
MMHPDRLRGQRRKKLCCVKVGLPFAKTTSMDMVLGKWKTVRPSVVRFCGIYNNIIRIGPKGGAGDADYVQRAMIHYEIDTRLPFKLRHYWEILKDNPKWQEIAIPNFNTWSEGGSKRHKSTGSSSFNTESEEASINQNTYVDDNNKYEDALTRLMVTEMIAHEKQESLAFLDIKRREVECREQEIEQQDMRFYLQPYDHLTGDQRKAMDAFDYASCPSTGRSGGLVSVWDTNSFTMTNVFPFEIVLIVEGFWISTKLYCFMVNVYAPKMKKDFNVVRSASERIGTVFNARSANVFNRFISEAHLLEIPQGGHLFTRINRRGDKLSKLDRFLISANSSSLMHNYSAQDDLRSKIKEFDDAMVSDSIHTVADSLRPLWLDELRNIELKENLDASQKAKVKWGIKADENSKFFHAIVNQKQRTLSIHGIKSEGQWLTDPHKIKDAFHSFFESKFKEGDVSRIENRSLFYKSLNDEQNTFLISNVQESEIRAAIWDRGSKKSPGPDGFTFAFYKKIWDSIKGDITTFVYEFFKTGIILKGCNTSFIALIPKISNSMVVSDFRPISLIGAQYKIIAKVLANRLAQVIDSIISREHEKWISWIQGCLTSASASILVNGSPNREYRINCGLRQGDPLSLFLFIIAMEGLHVAVEDAISASLYRGITVNNMMLSHLFFADDALFIGEWSRSNINNMVSILDSFHKVSGLKINLHKSSLFGIGVPFEEVKLLSLATG